MLGEGGRDHLPDRSPLQIALICTGNRFRSPLAEGFLRRYGHGLPLELQSFGTKDIGSVPVLPEALESAARYGLELDRHRARSLHAARLADADLVLGFERVHVATVVVDWDAARQRTFTLPEIVGLLALMPAPEGAPSTAEARRRIAKAHQSRARRGNDSLPELSDPLGGPAPGYSKIAGQLAGLCQSLLAGLFGAPLDENRERLQVQRLPLRDRS
jgi:protein-tyrosine-phosphatase